MDMLPSAQAKCRTYVIDPVDILNHVTDMIQTGRVPYHERIAFYFGQTMFIVVRSPFGGPAIS